MILYICIFLLIFVHSQTTTIAPINPLVEQKNQCEAIGPDLNNCEAAEKCTFYDISGREVLTLRSPIQVFTVNGWASGEVTAIHQAVGQDDMTVEYPCQMQDNVDIQDGAHIEVEEVENGLKIIQIDLVSPFRGKLKVEDIILELNGMNGLTPDDLDSAQGAVIVKFLKQDCTVTDARFSMRFREQNHTEIEGVRVTYPATKQREKLDRLDSDAGVVPTDIYSRISSLDGSEWVNIWIYAAFGEVIGLQGPDLIISKNQDCLLNPIWIPYYAEEIRLEHNQVPQATFCTQMMYEFDCERETNCVWEETVCLANSWTNDFLTCHGFKNQTSCNEHMEPNCKWLSPESNQYDGADSYCICCSAAQLNLAILFSLLLLIFLC